MATLAPTVIDLTHMTGSLTAMLIDNTLQLYFSFKAAFRNAQVRAQASAYAIFITYSL